MSPAPELKPGGELLRASLTYLVTGFVMFLVMGLLGLVMRLAQAGTMNVAPDLFYQLMTLHGSGMISAVLLAAMGGLAAVLGRYVRLSVRWLWIAFASFATGSGLVVLTVLLGKFAPGWTMLYPLPFSGKVWSLDAAIAGYVGVFFIGLSLLLYSINVLAAGVRAHGGFGNALGWRYLFSGGRDTSVPLPAGPELAGNAVSVVAILDVLLGVAYLALPLFGSGDVAQRANPLLAKNLLMLFGHTLANLTIYFSAGLAYAILPVYTGREWKTSWPVVLAFNLLLVLLFAPDPHHLYQDFAQPFPLDLLGEISTFLVGMPVVLVTVIGGLSLIHRSGIRWTVTPALIAIGFWGWVFGGIGATLDGAIPVNQVMHNTMWVPAHFHGYYLLGVVAFVLAYFYHLTGELSGMGERAASRVALWVFVIGAVGFLLLLFVAGAESVPRRFAVHLPEWQRLAAWSLPFVILQILGLGWLAGELLLRLGRAWRGASEVSR
jgi:cytochrome c oxidase subunit 1